MATDVRDRETDETDDHGARDWVMSKSPGEINRIRPILDSLRHKVVTNEHYSALQDQMETKKLSIAAWARLHQKEETNDRLFAAASATALDDALDMSCDSIWKYVSAWLFYFDKHSDELCMLAHSHGMALSQIVRSELQELVARSLRVPYGEGSSGFALRQGQLLCLDHVLVDPRGAVAVEDLLVGNFSYIAVPIREVGICIDGKPANQNNEILCFVGIVFPWWKAWQVEKRTKYKCDKGDVPGAHCFAEKIAQVVETAEHAIRMAVYWAKEQAVVEAFREAVKYGKNIGKPSGGASQTTDTRWDWKQFLEKLLFKDISPSPLGVKACLLYDVSQPEIARTEAASYAASDLNAATRTIMASQEVVINCLAVVPGDSLMNATWNRASLGIKQAQVSQPKAQPEDYLAAFLNQVGVEAELVHVLFEGVASLQGGVQGADSAAPSRTREAILLNLYVSSAAVFDRESFKEKVESLRTLLHAILFEVLPRVVTTAMVFEEKDDWRTFVLARLISGFRHLACQTFCDWLIGKTEPAKHWKDALSSYMSNVDYSELKTFADTLETTNASEVTGASRLWGAAIWIEESDTWHLSSWDPYGANDFSNDDISTTLLDPSVYKVQKFLANASASDLGNWPKGEVWDIDQEGAVLFRVASKGNDHAKSRLCGGVLGGRAFETQLSYLGDRKEPGIVAARRVTQDGTTRITYHTLFNGADSPLLDICKDTTKILDTTWTQKAGVACLGVTLSDGVLGALVTKASRSAAPRGSKRFRIQDYYKDSEETWLTFYLHFGDDFNPEHHAQGLVWPRELSDDVDRNEIDNYGRALLESGIMPLGDWFVTVVPVKVGESVHKLLNLFTRKSKLDPDKAGKMIPQSSKSLLFDLTQCILIEGAVDYAESFVQHEQSKEIEEKSEQALVAEKVFESLKSPLKNLVDHIHEVERQAIWIQERIRPEARGILSFARLDNLRRECFSTLTNVHGPANAEPAHVDKIIVAIEEFLRSAPPASDKDGTEAFNNKKYLLTPLVNFWKQKSDDEVERVKWAKRVFLCTKLMLADLIRLDKPLHVAQIAATLSQLQGGDRKVYVNGTEIKSNLLTDDTEIGKFLTMRGCFHPSNLDYPDTEEYSRCTLRHELVTPLHVCAALMSLLEGPLLPRSDRNPKEVTVKRVDIFAKNDLGKVAVVLTGTGRFENPERTLNETDELSIRDLASNMATLARAVGQTPTIYKWTKAQGDFPWNEKTISKSVREDKMMPGHNFIIYEHGSNNITIFLTFDSKEK